MAKVPFTKLKCKINDSINTIEFNGEAIEVKQYLPIQEKLKLISDVVMQAHEQDANYSNPVKASVYTDLEVVFTYTNISFTDKQKEDSPKLYDMLESSGLLQAIIDTIPFEEYQGIKMGVRDSIEAIYKYQNSVLGILDNLKSEYEDLSGVMEDLKKTLSDPEQLNLVHEMLSKLN